MKKKQSDEKFSDAEAKSRLEAALRGARISGHKSMSEIAPKRLNPQRKKKSQRKLGPKGPSQD